MNLIWVGKCTGLHNKHRGFTPRDVLYSYTGEDLSLWLIKCKNCHSESVRPILHEYVIENGNFIVLDKEIKLPIRPPKAADFIRSSRDNVWIPHLR